jgi:hypothetical protein
MKANKAWKFSHRRCVNGKLTYEGLCYRTGATT